MNLFTGKYEGKKGWKSRARQGRLVKISMTMGKQPRDKRVRLFNGERHPCGTLIIAAAFRCNCSDEQRPINYHEAPTGPRRFIGGA